MNLLKFIYNEIMRCIPSQYVHKAQTNKGDWFVQWVIDKFYQVLRTKKRHSRHLSTSSQEHRFISIKSTYDKWMVKLKLKNFKQEKGIIKRGNKILIRFVSILRLTKLVFVSKTLLS